MPFRENVIFDMAKCVSKEGNFSLVYWLDTLKGVLSPEQARDLYVAIRDKSSRVEFEWRAEFIAAFPDAESLLPPIAVDDNLRFAFLHRLAQAVDAQDSENTAQLIVEIEWYGIPYADLGKVNPETIADGGIYFEYTYPDDPAGVALLDLARQKGTPQILLLLEEFARRTSKG
jgi:hypothetical protein